MTEDPPRAHDAALAALGPEAPPRSLANFPITAFGISMGLSGTSLAWRRDSDVLEWTGIAGEVLAWIALGAFVAVAVTYGAKLVRHPGAVRREWARPSTMPFAGTLSISMLLLAATFLDTLPGPAEALWWAGALTQVVLTVGMVRAWVAQSGISTRDIHPAWLIPMIGMLAVPIAGVEITSLDLNWFFFSVGGAYYLALLPLVLHRLIAVEAMPAALAPTLAVLIAPPAVALTAWVSLGGGMDSPLAHVLRSLVLFHLLLLATQVDTLRRAPFALSWWAYTFPLGSASVALIASADAGTWVGHRVVGVACLAILSLLLCMLTYRTAAMAVRGDLFRPQKV
mgnify:CR=1 FL=1